jgi:hypothetical protein
VDVNLARILNTAVSSPATAGILDVNVKNMNNVAATSITTINANQGTTQPLNFTGTAGSALVKSDMVDIAGAAVSTSTAQIGVNVVNFGGSAGTFATGRPEVNATQFAGQAITAASGVTLPSSVASPTNITAGTITTVTNLTNAPTNGDLTATMKASVTTAATAATPTAAAVTGSVGSVASGGISRASFAADSGLQNIRANTAQAGASTTITLDASASSVSDFYVNCLVYLTGGTGVGQARYITAYNGTTKVATVTAWKTNPDNTTTFAILPADAIVGATAPTAAQNATAVWTDLLAGSDFSTASSIGKLLKDNVDAAISSRMATYTQPTGFLAATFPTTVASTTNITAGTITTVTNLTNAPTSGDFTATMKSSITTAATAATPVAASVTGAVGSVVGNVGGNVTGSVGSLATQAKTDVENATWNTVLSGHLTSGSTGAALNAAGAAGDPWSTTLPGAYGAGTAGYIVGTNVDALISSRLATAGYTAPLSAAGTRTALGMASANLDTQLTPMSNLDATVSSRLPTSSYTAAPSAASNATAVWAKVLEGSYTAGDELRLIAAAAAAGVTSGAATSTFLIKDLLNSKTRISAIIDGAGNRTAVTIVDAT